MRKIYECNSALKFFEHTDSKTKNKLNFLLNYIADEHNRLCEPYVRHISASRYKELYELRLRASGCAFRIMFCLADEDVILLHTFCKTDKKDSAKGLKAAYRMLDIAGKSKAEVVL